MANLEGISNQDNSNLYGLRVNPADPVGDVGPTVEYGISVHAPEMHKMINGETKVRAVQFFLDSAVVPISLMGDGLLPLDIDPRDDCTFWYANEYYTLAGQLSSTAGWQTRIASFKLPGRVARQ